MLLHAPFFPLLLCYFCMCFRILTASASQDVRIREDGSSQAVESVGPLLGRLLLHLFSCFNCFHIPLVCFDQFRNSERELLLHSPIFPLLGCFCMCFRILIASTSQGAKIREDGSSHLPRNVGFAVDFEARSEPVGTLHLPHV